MTQVVVSSSEGLQQEVWAGRHTLVADEPVDAGGADAGVTPYELLLAALGACTSMTLLLYARRKAWTLTNVEVRLTHERVHVQDCVDCETRPAFLDRIGKEIILSGELNPEQVARLGEVAELCPVNRTLTGKIHIAHSIRLAAGPAPDPDTTP